MPYMLVRTLRKKKKVALLQTSRKLKGPFTNGVLHLHEAGVALGVGVGGGHETALLFLGRLLLPVLLQ